MNEALYMDNEIQKEFAKMNDKLTSINLTMERNLSYHKGLNMPQKMTNIEQKYLGLRIDVDKKPSWVGLFMTVGSIVGIVTVALTIARGN